jgi:hypothetical protein
VDQYEQFYRRKPPNRFYDQINPLNSMEYETNTGDEVDNEENELDSEDTLSEKRTPMRKNPDSGMSVRAAKRLWFSPRKSGRPNKDLSDKLQEAKNVLVSAGEPLKRLLVRKAKNEERRPRGRPKKPLVATSLKEKRPRGRPRKNPTAPTVDKPKRARGRPRKHLNVVEKPHRPRGRPRKNPVDGAAEDPKNKR